MSMLRRLLITLAFLSITTLCFSAFPPVQWKELDGSPSLFPTQVIVPNNGIETTTGSIVELDFLTSSYTETDPKVGSLTTNYLPKWSATSLVDSLISDDGSIVTITGNTILGDIASNNYLLTLYTSDDGSYTHGILLIDGENHYGSWQNPSGLDGIETDVNGVPNAWGYLYFNYYSSGDIIFNRGGGKSQFMGKLGILETGATPTRYTYLQGGDQTVDLTYTLPTAFPTINSQALLGSTAGVMSWGTDFGANNLTTTGTVTGSVVSLEGGTYDTYLSAGTPTASVYYKLPLADGTVGQSMITNGAGQLSFSSAGAGDMTKAVYDASNVAEQLTGLTAIQTLTNKTFTSPKINENVVLTTTATKLNYLTSATGTTGTTSQKIVFDTSPTLVTPILGAATATSVYATATVSGVTVLQSGVPILTSNQSITLSGDVSGTGTTAITATVVDDSHAHTTTSISGLDISADTNLTAGDHITLTDDDLDVDDDFVLNTSDTMSGSLNVANTVTGVVVVASSNLTIPNGVSPNVSGVGKIGIDTTDDQLLYYGSALRVVPYTYEKCFTVFSPVATDDNIPIWTPVDNITITSQYCRVEGGTSAVITVSDGTNDMEAITCDTDGQADDGSLINNTFTGNERMEYDTGTVTGTVTACNMCIRYTYDSQ